MMISNFMGITGSGKSATIVADWRATTKSLVLAPNKALLLN